MMAARYNQSHIVEYLISQGADPNASDFYGATPLLEAAKNCSADSMRRLVSSKASINHADRGGITALIYVAKNGCVALVDYLARSMKANVHLKDQTGQSALDYAAQEGVVEVDGPYLNIAKMLMDLGAKTDFYLTAEQLEKGSTQSHFKRSKPATPRPVPVPAQPSRSTRVIIK
jgi:ankyrin repeat protein